MLSVVPRGTATGISEPARLTLRRSEIGDAGTCGRTYVGGYHLARRRAAAVLTTPDRILILSVLHGLLPLDRVIAPYDLRMGQPGSITPAAPRRQAEQLHLVDEPRVIVLAGHA